MIPKKENILISWASYNIQEHIFPLIENLSNKYNIVITIIDCFIPEDLIGIMDKMYEQKQILKYYVIPSPKDIKTQFIFFKTVSNEIRLYNFKFWLTNSKIQIHDQYINDYILSKNCKKIILSVATTPLLEKKDIIIKLFPEKFFNLETNLKFKATPLNKASEAPSINLIFRQKITKRLLISNLLEKFKKRTFVTNIKYLFIRIFNFYLIHVKKRFDYFFNRILLPLYFFKRTFKINYQDKITQLGSNKTNIYIFTDPLEVEAHKLFLINKKVFLARHSSYGLCTCDNLPNNNRLKKNILSPLSGFVGVDKIDQKWLDLFLRDFLIVKEKIGFDQIHLRKHPRETHQWPYQLSSYLNDNGVKAKIVEANLTFREITCKYKGVIGSSSNSLRNARAACNNVFVIAFEGVSFFRYSNPKLIFGLGEGINWINADGTYNKDISYSNEYAQPKRDSITKVIENLFDNGVE